MMTRTQKILLFCSSFCYALTLYALVAFNYSILLICFMLHSVLLISFAYFCFRSQEERTPETIKLREELENVRNDRRDVRTALEDRIRELEGIQKHTEEKLAEAEEKAATLERTLEDERDKTMAIVTTAEKDASRKTLNSILPEIDPTAMKNSTVDIIEIAQKAADDFSEAAAQAGLTITVSSHETELYVRAHPDMLRILFRNIIDNSIKYMKRHGTLVITISNIGDELFIVLKDTGEGLPAEETRHIFELNYQGSNRISGNGLGLAQAKAIVEYYGGTIYAKSTPGKGMGIFAELPTT